MVKLDDVAKLAGVSKGTASRVLNNRGYISQQTRERIEAAVKELNYYPNENARNLLKRRSGMIEALEYGEQMLGVQFHPEADDQNDDLFRVVL